MAYTQDELLDGEIETLMSLLKAAKKKSQGLDDVAIRRMRRAVTRMTEDVRDLYDSQLVFLK